MTNAVLRLLSEVQEGDLEILSLEDELAKLYSTMREYKEQIEGLEAKKVAADKNIMDLQVRLNLDEVSFKEAQESVESLRTHLKESKNLKEYHGLNTQISSKTSAMKIAEDEMLKALEALDACKQDVVKLEEEIQGIQVKVQEAEASVSDDVAELNKAIDGHKEVRDSKTKDIDPDLLAEYDRLFKHFDGEAICGVDDRTCEGCFMSLTANHMVLVKTSTEIVRCPSCGRMLFDRPAVNE